MEKNVGYTKITMDDIPISFLDTMGQFLDALHEVYPECIKVSGYRIAFKAKVNFTGSRVEVGEEGMRMYNTIMRPFYERCSDKDEGLLNEDIEFLHDLGMYTKWPTMDNDTKEAVWEFINLLNRTCYSWSLTSIIPDSIMSTVKEGCEKMASGEMTTSTLIQFMMSKIMQEKDQLAVMAEHTNPEEIQTLMKMLINSGEGNSDIMALAQNFKMLTG